MKKLSGFIVSKRYWIFSLMILITIVSLVLSQYVSINTDMTKYLADDSSMKIGMDIMEEEFPELDSANTIRVMATDLVSEEKTALAEKLKAIPGVDSVEHDDTTEYNKDQYSLFVLSTSAEHGSSELEAIEKSLSSDFSDYNIVYKNDSAVTDPMPPILVAAAIIIAMIILFIMSESWIEPILILCSVGVAVFINAGTNIILGETSNITSSISAILQMVLSMDYSIILMNRFRQEREAGLPKYDAMKSALASSFSSIAGSAFTTVAGLLALVFMNFKIGFDLGVVLAKGVFISMVCVITIQPCLVLWFDKIIKKTAKKPLTIPMGWASKLSFRLRRVFAVVFVILFVAFSVLQGNTDIAFSTSEVDPIADVFPKETMLVLLYENEDEEKMAELSSTLEEDSNVKQLLSYSTLFEKSYTADELTEALENLGGEGLDESLAKIIYFHKNGEVLSSMTVSEFASFLCEDVMNDELFSSAIDSESAEQVEKLLIFADAEKLTEPKTPEELADFFGIDSETVESLLVYRLASNEEEETKMTLAAFAEFVSEEIESNEELAEMFDEDTKALVEQMKKYTDVSLITKRMTYPEISEALDIDDELSQMIFVLLQQDYAPEKMTLTSLAQFANEKIVPNPIFSSFIAGEAAQGLGMLSSLSDAQALVTPATADVLAAKLGMDVSVVETVFVLHNSRNIENGTMTIAEFVTFVSESILTDPLFSAYFSDDTVASLQSLKSLVWLASSGEMLDAGQISALTGMSEQQIGEVFGYYALMNQVAPVSSMTLPQFVSVASELVPNDPTLSYLNNIVSLTVSSAPLDAKTLSGLFSVDEGLCDLIIRLCAGADIEGKTMSLREMLDFMVNGIFTDPILGAQFDITTVSRVTALGNIVECAVADTELSYTEASALLGVEEGTVKLLFTYRDALAGKGDDWKLSLQAVVDYLANGGAYLVADPETAGTLKMLNSIITSAVSGTSYTAAELSALLSTEEEQIDALYLLYSTKRGDYDDLKLSVKDTVDFLCGDFADNEELAGLIDTETKTLLGHLKALADAALSEDEYVEEGIAQLISPLSEKLDLDTVELLYFLKSADSSYDEKWAMTPTDLADYVCDVVVSDPMLESFIDEDTKASAEDLRSALDEGKEMLRTDEYSRIVIYTELPEESEETWAFIEMLNGACAENTGEYHLIGNAAMNFELDENFDSELLLITVLTSVAIFLIVMVTFRSLVVPIILVLIVQCGVYITVTAVGIGGYSIHYMALLIVECILMGATIDYGILLTNYYRDKRKNAGIEEALHTAYDGSIHTIMTSGAIIVLVTAIIGFTYSDPTIAQICRTISIGVFAALMLILFVLPGMLSAFDRFVVRRKK